MQLNVTDFIPIRIHIYTKLQNLFSIVTRVFTTPHTANYSLFLKMTSAMPDFSTESIPSILDFQQTKDQFLLLKRDQVLPIMKKDFR